MFRSHPLLVIITGPPCSGKTTLARSLAQQAGLSLIAKDVIKEALFDSLGWKDAAWSQELSLATYAIQFAQAGELLSTGKSLILEGTFKGPEHAAHLIGIQQQTACTFIQAQCGAQGDVLVQRFLSRWESGVRHPGHVDPEIFPGLEPTLRAGWYPPLEIPGSLYRLDATDFAAPAWTAPAARLLEEITVYERI